MHAKPDLRVFLKWMIAGSGSVITAVMRLVLSSINASVFTNVRLHFMHFDESTTNSARSFRLSNLWDICVPLSIGLVPAFAFTLLRLVTVGLDKPGAIVPAWVAITMFSLQLLGMVSMAVVVLIRADYRRKQLSIFTDGNPAAWRSWALGLSMLFLLMFDVILNVAGAFCCGPLLFLAIPMFIAYLGFIYLAFARLKEK